MQTQPLPPFRPRGVQCYGNGVGSASWNLNTSGNVLEQVFGVIRDTSGTAADQTGDVADWLITAGLSVAAIRQILNGVATSAEASPGIIQSVQLQNRYLDAYEAQMNPGSRWLVPALLVGGVLLFLSTRKKSP